MEFKVKIDMVKMIKGIGRKVDDNVIGMGGEDRGFTRYDRVKKCIKDMGFYDMGLYIDDYTEIVEEIESMGISIRSTDSEARIYVEDGVLYVY